LDSRCIVIRFIRIAESKDRFALALFCILQIGILPYPAAAWSIEAHSAIANAATELLSGPWRQFFASYAGLLAETATYPDTYSRFSR